MDPARNEWETVVFRKKPDLATAQRTGRVQAVAKPSGATGKARKLDAATGEDGFKHAKVSKSFARALQQARLAQKLSQKALATKINEKPTVISQYESGKAIPNPQIVQKLSRALGCQLPRPTPK
jgi:putative transcription factor